ncbi:esophageal gland cell secretory protein 21, partial [Aphelenchoides avenae]
ATFKNDPHRESAWPQGWGQLTPTGMQQHLWLGQKLAQKYVHSLGFLSGSYRSDEVYVRSTDVNRTLISAMSNFIGFYGRAAKNGTDYPNDPSWPAYYVPIPVHTVDYDLDYVGVFAE